jgi:NADPH-dependent curcumin reductase
MFLTESWLRAREELLKSSMLQPLLKQKLCMQLYIKQYWEIFYGKNMWKNKQMHLVARPEKNAMLEHFKLLESQIPGLQDGEFLVEHHFLSIDPYMRGRMSAAKSYVAPQKLDQTMGGATVGRILESRNSAMTVGSWVLSVGGWQHYQVLGQKNLKEVALIDVAGLQPSLYLGSLGMPGVTAWYAINRIFNIKPGAAVLVSAATGGVGSVAGQLAKKLGAFVVGLAGSDEKCNYATSHFAYDVCINYKNYPDIATLKNAILEVCPEGIDYYLDNVGGYILDAALQSANLRATVAVCGFISSYDGEKYSLSSLDLVLQKRLRLQGFILGDHMDVWGAAVKDLKAMALAGNLESKESVLDGLENAPLALLDLLQGRNFGKQLIRLTH